MFEFRLEIFFEELSKAKKAYKKFKDTIKADESMDTLLKAREEFSKETEPFNQSFKNMVRAALR